MGRDLESRGEVLEAEAAKDNSSSKPKTNGTTVTLSSSLTVPTKSTGITKNGSGDKDDLFEGGKEDSFTSFSSGGELGTPPDGGWGWVIVFASFMIHFIGERQILTHFLHSWGFFCQFLMLRRIFDYLLQTNFPRREVFHVHIFVQLG